MSDLRWKHIIFNKNASGHFQHLNIFYLQHLAKKKYIFGFIQLFFCIRFWYHYLFGIFRLKLCWFRFSAFSQFTYFSIWQIVGLVLFSIYFFIGILSEWVDYIKIKSNKFSKTNFTSSQCCNFTGVFVCDRVTNLLFSRFYVISFIWKQNNFLYELNAIELSKSFGSLYL